MVFNLPRVFADLTSASLSFLDENFNAIATAIRNAIRSNTYNVDQYADLNEATTAIATSNATLIISTQTTLSGDLTIPSNVIVEFSYPGKIATAGFSLVVNGKIVAGEYQIFSGFAAGEITFGINNATVPAEWFNAKGDNSTTDTTAILSAIGAISATTGGTLVVRAGKTYRINNVLQLVDRSKLTVTGGGTIRQMDGTKVTFNISGGKEIRIEGVTLYGTFETTGPTGDAAMISINPWTGSQENEDITIENVTFKYNSNDAIYAGGNSGTYGINRLKILRCKMIEGLAFLLSAGVKNMIIDDIICIHRNIAPLGVGGAQDEDIAVYSGNGISSENISITNITIDSRGDVTNANTGYPKIAIGISTSGLYLRNVTIDNVKILNNIGNYTPTYGSEASSIYFSDSNATFDRMEGVNVSNISTNNSSGIFLEAKNINFKNINLVSFSTPANFVAGSYGIAISATQANGANGCNFSNINIKDWASPWALVYLPGSKINVDGLQVTNATRSVLASSYSNYINMVFDNAGDSNYGAFHFDGTMVGLNVSNSVFMNSPYTALMDNVNNYSSGLNFANIKFYNNAVDFNFIPGYHYITNVAGANLPVFANNAAAITGGRVVGSLYRITGSDATAAVH